MLKKSFFILGCLFRTILGFSQTAAPPIEEIAAKFYNTYQDTYQGAYITFEKRPGQWKIGTLKYQGSHPVPGRSFLFFDSDSGGYQKLPFDRKTDTQWVDFRQKLGDYLLAGFQLHDYYGYNGKPLPKGPFCPAPQRSKKNFAQSNSCIILQSNSCIK